MDKKVLCDLLLTFCVDQQLQIKAGTMRRDYPDAYDLLIKFTDFLPDTIQFNARVYSIIHNISEKPKCSICNMPTKWSRLFARGFQQYCSSRCKSLDPTQQEKAKQGIRRKYNVKNVGQLSWVKKKREQTNLKRFGAKHAAQNIEIQQKTRKTNIERYGVNHAMCLSEIQTKTKQTNLERYGVEYIQQSQVFRNKSIITNQEKYKVNFKSQEHIPQDILEKLNDKNWLETQHHEMKKSLLQISNDLGVCDGTVGRYLRNHEIELKQFCRSQGEMELCSFLTKHNIKFETGNRKIVSPKELDIFIPEKNIAFEYNGLYWHSEQAGKDKWYHYTKWKLCQQQNVQLITIFEDEWQNRRSQVKQKILHLLGKNNDRIIYARNTTIREVTPTQKKTFLTNYHIQGNGHSSINVGLYKDNELLACASFIQTSDQLILNRYATSVRVVGGFSKLIKFIERNKKLTLITFADLRWSVGSLYEKTGWIKDKILPPDYSYVNHNRRVHKFNYRRKYLPLLLNTYDEKKSERENCNINNVLRIWDCGKIKYTYNCP